MSRLPVLLLLVAPSIAAADAAVKAREGEINHWIEYYRRDRQTKEPPRPAAQEGARREPARAEGGATEKESKR
ncbi:MAG: hypothetical protein ACREU7_16765 [Burkholderiales bacterium]